jgi:DNA-binding GntR family transcriptional regulator
MSQQLVRTMSEQVVSRIRERILTGAYAPGSPLLQDAIAAEFGVSKIPVREALVQLRADGLVDIFAHRGFQVRPLSTAELEEVFRLRLALEPAAVAHGAQIADAEDRLRAASALSALNEALEHGDLGLSGEFNSRFHLALVVPRLQPVSNEVLYRLHTLAQRYVRLHLVPAGRSTRATREHTALHAAWLAGRVREVRSLARAHIEETRRELSSYLSSRDGTT